MQKATFPPDKPVLDEDSFQKLLAAAYVLQEYNSRSPAKEPAADFTQTLATIVETQHFIQMQHLDLQASMMLIAERVQMLTNADGAAIGVVEGDQLRYRAGIGSAAPEMGSCVPFDSSAHFLRLGQVLQCPDLGRDSQVNTEIFGQRGAKSVIAVPVYHEGKIAGVVELLFAAASAFQEHDVRTCQLMAGLVTEAIAKAAELEWKRTLAAERATMLETLEKIKPQLERLVAQPRNASAGEVQGTKPGLTHCRACGHRFEASEVFCGSCGVARDSERTSVGGIREKNSPTQFDDAAAKQAQSPPDSAEVREERVAHSEAPNATEAAPSLVRQDSKAPSTTPAWTSAAGTKQWLESVRAQRLNTSWMARLWRSHRANVYLAAAVLLLFVVVFSGGPKSYPGGTSPDSVSASTAGSPGGAASAAARRRKRPQQNLTLFEKALVGLGLAEAPSPPAYLGNPDTKVWVDLHTALYYCPGADLYGKTPKGKFTTQIDAQQDQFEPAFRKACD